MQAGPDKLPKFRQILWEFNLGNLVVERIYKVDGMETIERYSVSTDAVLFTSFLQQHLPDSTLTYLDAAFTPNGPALSKDFEYGFKLAVNSGWSISKSDVFTVLSLLLTIGFMYLIYRSTMRPSGGSIFSPAGGAPMHKIKSKTKFTDIAGNAEVKEEVEELIDYLRDPKRYASAGARIPKGILLGGPPGTGKTLIAKAVAGEADVPFYFISASGFVEMIVGLGARRVRDLFKQARADAPSIIFIDELDAVGRSRRDFNVGGGDSEREQTLNQLLVEMDGMVENSGVLIIGATNRHDLLDPALLRPGRFDRVVRVFLPDYKEREQILKLHAKGKRFDSNVSFLRIAKRTPGFSGAQLENVINEATLLSVRERSKKITLAHIDEAIDRVMSGPAKKSRTISELENIRVAYHEAGHAVVGIKLEGANKVQKITIVPRGDAGGYNLMIPEEEKYFPTRREFLATIASFMGGRAAEELIYGFEDITAGSAQDLNQATRIAKQMVIRYGMSDIGPIFLEEQDRFSPNASSQETACQIDREVRAILETALQRAREIIKENLQLLELIKDTLIEKETIIAEEIEELSRTLQPLQSLSSPEHGEKSDANDEDIVSLLEEVEG